MYVCPKKNTMIFKIKIFANQIFSVRYAISQKSLNIKVIETSKIPGQLSSDEPDTQLTLKLMSEDLGEIFTLGWRAAKEPTPIRTF